LYYLHQKEIRINLSGIEQKENGEKTNIRLI